MIVFGLLARKRCGQKSPDSRKGKICQPRHALCWCVLWRIRKTAFHFSQGKRKMANFTVKVCYPNWLKIASIVCHVVLYSSRTERLLTLQSWLKTGLPLTAVTSSEKTKGYRTHQTLTLLTIMSEELCVNATRHLTQAKYHRRPEESLAVHMRRSATELYQQGHNEQRQKNCELV